MKAFLILSTLGSVALAQPVKLVDDGRAVAEVVVSDDAGTPYHFVTRPRHLFSVDDAAEELVATLRRISGAEVPVRRVKAGAVRAAADEVRKEGRLPILLGGAAAEWLGERGGEIADPSGFFLLVDREAIAIRGATAAGTTFGVYEALEQVGVRWFFPGELGTVIPKESTLTLEKQARVEVPSLAARYFPVPGTDDWMKRQRMGGLYFPPSHGIPLGRGVTVETHPEFFSLVGGVRTKRQVCVSNPEVLQRAIAQVSDYFRRNPEEPWIGMGPNDGSGFCECGPCREMDGGDWDAFSHEPSVTDRYILFFNRVLDGIAKEHPDKMIAFYVYHTYMRPPVKVKPSERIAAAMAPIGLCRIHGVNNPVCPERDYLRQLVTEWTRQVPNFYERGYWFNLADPGMLFSQIHRMREEIPFYAAHGTKGFRVECLGQWAVEGPSLYVAGKLLWDVKADPDALLKDFCDKLFGPASAPMLAYFEAVEARLRDADHHAGSAFDITQIFPTEFRQELGGRIAEAQNLATASPYRERVVLFADGFAHSDRLASMIEAQNRHEWSRAAEELAELDAVQARLLAYDPPMMRESAAAGYLARFFRLPVEQGAARVSNGNRLVAALSTEWDFLTDPQGVGSDLQYQRREITGGNWQKIDTTRSWSDLGLRYTKGLSWYRQQVSIPAEMKGQRLFLWFGGVDEAARVWVNGQLVGTSPSSSFTPFEVDITEAIDPGGKNVVAVCVANERVDEIGTGGITAPAMIYAPAAGDRAELENVRPLRDTFP